MKCLFPCGLRDLHYQQISFVSHRKSNDEADIIQNNDIESGNEDDEQWSGDSDSDDETVVQSSFEQYTKP